MQEKDREKIALFRYGLIAPILNGQVGSKKSTWPKYAARFIRFLTGEPGNTSPRRLKSGSEFMGKKASTD